MNGNQSTRSGLFEGILILTALMLPACGGGGGSTDDSEVESTSYNVTATAGTNGSIDPASATVDEGKTTRLIVTADSGYQIDSVSGCNGSLSGNTYTTGAVNADCTVTANFVADPQTGASFTKLDNAGNPLSDQSLDYATTPWACVRDAASGLLWEVKTNDGGLQDTNSTYSYFDSSGAVQNQGGDNLGQCTSQGRCDSEKYIAQINADNVCGHNDWRVPTRSEWLSILNYGANSGGAMIDNNYFPNYIPNTQRDEHWTLSRAPSGFNYYSIDLSQGYSTSSTMTQSFGIRLVTGGINQ